MKFHQMVILWLPKQTIFINRSIIIIAGSQERASRRSSKIGSSMILVIIHKGASFLDESGNCKGQIFNWSMVNRASKLLKPSTPCLGPYCGLVRFVWGKIITIKEYNTAYHWIRCIVFLAHNPRDPGTHINSHFCSPSHVFMTTRAIILAY
nr:hypothetical protein CR513_44271 [Ipomoea batatas]